MAYCGYDLCTTDQYCCGINECCNNPFLKLYVGVGLSLLVFLILLWFFYCLHGARVSCRRKKTSHEMNEDDEPLLHSKDLRSISVPE